MIFDIIMRLEKSKMDNNLDLRGLPFLRILLDKNKNHHNIKRKNYLSDTIYPMMLFHSILSKGYLK